MASVREEARDVPVTGEWDVCVIGGGCTGVFAAVAAARCGATVCLIENNGFFGGVATAGLVNLWHTVLDERCERPIIGGLTMETLHRLHRRGGAFVRLQGENSHRHNAAPQGLDPLPKAKFNFVLNTEELKLALDELVVEARVRPFLHARCVAAALRDGKPIAAVIEDKTGRRALRAACFVDASGDGDFIAQAGLSWTKNASLMPPTACARVRGLRAMLMENPSFNMAQAVFDPGNPKALPKGFLWSAEVAGAEDETMVAGTRVAGTDGTDADSLTQAEMEGRRQIRALMDILREQKGGGRVSLAAAPACIGLRESRKAVWLHRLTVEELLRGTRFPDAIANGTYPVDIHYTDKPGIVWRRLDGTESYFPEKGPAQHGRWRAPLPQDPTFYQIPYRSLVPRGAANVLAAGRIIDTDSGAFGATRVMVNCNQTGEAAGTAAFLSVQQRRDAGDVRPDELRRLLAKNGAIVV